MTEPSFKPKFKKKAVSGQNRRRKDPDPWDSGPPASSPALSPAKPAPPPPKWEKFRALRDLSGTQPSSGLSEPPEDILPANPASDLEPALVETSHVPVTENTAFKTLNMASTFSLTESHFRAGPERSLETEYADAFGNISDDDRPASEELPDNMQVLSDVDADSHMYDSELSMDEDAPAPRRLRSVPAPAAILAQVAGRIAELSPAMDAKQRRLASVQESLLALDARRHAVLLSLHQ